MIIYSTLFKFNNIPNFCARRQNFVQFVRFLFNNFRCPLGQRTNKVTPKKWRPLWRLRQRALRIVPHQSYAEGFDNVRRVRHNSTPLVAYYANNCPRAIIRASPP